MADEEDLLGSMDELEDKEEEEGEGGSPLMKYLPLIGGALVVQIILAWIVGSMFFAPSEDELAEGEEDPATTEEVVVADGTMIEKEVVWEGLDPIVVNPAGTGGLRFANIHVNLGLTSEAVQLAIDQKSLTSRIRDTLIGILATKTLDQLDPRYHEMLKVEMRDKLNEFMSQEGGPAAVKRIYFKQFVLQ
ncbi:flagellar basal body-associated FliL family protein [bacterium]|jgi:flagellar basal body-associated protein FliL|nr:flagellar basal body-associated FliL family protein [bacterium]